MNLDLPFVNNDDHLPFVNNPRNPATPMKRLALLLPLLALAAAPAHAEDPAANAPAALPAIDDSVSSEELWRRATGDHDFGALHELRKRAFKGDDEAMSLYFWKTDHQYDWWFRYSFFPVTIRSVEPEKGEDANAATNWIVTLLGGIKVRTADPAAVFGAPLDALPGRRLGVRFGEYKGGWLLDGAPSAMSNACVYAGAIEVRPLLPASEIEAARKIIDRNLDNLTRLTAAGRKELEERIGECWANPGSGRSFPTWYFEDGVWFRLVDNEPTDEDFWKAICEDETPAATVDGEVAATWGEVAREAIHHHWTTERAAKSIAESFLLNREAKKHGFASVRDFVRDGIPEKPEDEAELRTLWEESRAKFSGRWGGKSFEEARGWVLDAWIDARADERRAKLLAPLLEKAKIEYTPMPNLRDAALSPHAEGAFFFAALERAREIAARAGAECHVRTLYSATRGLEFKRGTQLAAQLTVPNPSADEDKTWLSKATATLYLGLVGTNGVDLADYDDEIRYGELRKKADANGIVSTGQGTQFCLRPTIRNKCLHWTDGTAYAILQYPVRFEPALFAGLWRETTNAVAGRALSAPPPADIPEARPDDLEEEGVRLLPVLTERFAGAGLERIWTCWFVSRAPLYDGSFLRLSSGQGLDNTKNREWWMRMTAHAADPANPARDPAVADLFYGRTDGRPFVLEDYALANRGRTPKIRAWTDGDRFVVLRPYTPRDEDVVWDRFFEITTNVVRGPVFAP